MMPLQMRLRIVLKNVFLSMHLLLEKTNSTVRILKQTMVMPLMSGLMSGMIMTMTKTNVMQLNM